MTITIASTPLEVFFTTAGNPTINGIIEAQKVAYGFPELRCTFGDRSIVADVAVLRWSNIPFFAILMAYNKPHQPRG